MKSINQFVDGAGNVYSVAEGEESDFQAAMQQKGIAPEDLEPRHAFVDRQSGQELYAADSELDAFLVKMSSQGRQIEPMRQVVLDNGSVKKVADSERDDFLKAYQSGARPEFKQDRQAVQQQIAQSAPAQNNPSLAYAALGGAAEGEKDIARGVARLGTEELAPAALTLLGHLAPKGSGLDRIIRGGQAGLEKFKTDNPQLQPQTTVGDFAGQTLQNLVPLVAIGKLTAALVNETARLHDEAKAAGKSDAEANAIAGAGLVSQAVPLAVLSRIPDGKQGWGALQKLWAGVPAGEKAALTRQLLAGMAKSGAAFGAAMGGSTLATGELEKQTGIRPDAQPVAEAGKSALQGLISGPLFAFVQAGSHSPASQPSALHPSALPDARAQALAGNRAAVAAFAPPLEPPPDVPPTTETPAVPAAVPPEPGGPGALASALDRAGVAVPPVSDVPAVPADAETPAARPVVKTAPVQEPTQSAIASDSSAPAPDPILDNHARTVLGLPVTESINRDTRRAAVAAGMEQPAVLASETDPIRPENLERVAQYVAAVHGVDIAQARRRVARTSPEGLQQVLTRLAVTGSDPETPATRFSILHRVGPSHTDAEYQAAVDKGDTGTAQRMVNDAATDAGYTRAGWHGTQQGEFNTFTDDLANRNAYGPGHYFAHDETTATRYSKGAEGNRIVTNQGDQPAVVSAKLRMQRPFPMDSAELSRADLRTIETATGDSLGPFDRAYRPTGTTVWTELVVNHGGGDAANAILRKAGFDGIVAPQEMVVFDPANIKRADAVTMSDGKPVPLSERFNPQTSDIRFSVAQGDSVPATPEASALRARVSSLFPEHAALVEVVNTGADLPDAARAEAQRRFGEGGHNQVEAVWHDGKVYINAANVPPERVAALVFHEVGIHEGLRRALGPERFGKLMDSIAAAMSPEDRQAIAGKYRLNAYVDGWQREAGEEWLARLAEDAKTGGRWKAVYDRAVSTVNDFSRALGVQVRYSPAEVRDMLRQGMRAAAHERGEPTPASDTPVDRSRFSVVSRAWDDLQRKRNTLLAEWRTTPAKRDMAATRDFVDTAAKTYAKATANDVLGPLRRALGNGFNGSSGSPARIALTAMRESGQDRATLEAFVPQLEAILRDPQLDAVHKPAKKYLDGVAYALDHFDVMQGPAAEYKRATRRQLNEENAGGMPTAMRANYVYHAQEREPYTALDQEGSGTIGNFLRQRTAGDTFVDSMANGVKPVTLDAIDLLQGRVERGQRMLNTKQWTSSLLPSITEPTTGKPVMTEMIPADPDVPGRDRPTAPPGYTRIEVGAGQHMAIHEGYAGIFKALTGESLFNHSYAGRGIMGLVGGAKHIVLIGDTFHLGRVAYNVVGLTGTPGYKRGVLLLDYSTPELTRMSQYGEIDPQILPGLLRDKADLGTLITHGLNVGNIADAFNQDWVRKYSPLGGFNRWLFEDYQRGAMARAALIEYRRQQKMNPAAPAAELAGKVSFALNTKFGNLGRQGWIGQNQTFQDLARIFLLAPGWNEGLIRSQLQSIKDVGQLPVDAATKKRIIIGTQLRVTITLLAAGLIANQIINQITRGKFTWENPEEGFDSKISAWVPDEVGNGPGMFMSPAAIPAEIAHQIGERWEKTGRLDKAVNDVLHYKISPAARMARVLLLREDQFGKATKDAWDTIKTAAEEGIPAPIGGSAIFRAGRQLATGTPSERFPGQFQKQVMASVGIKTTGAPDPHQRVSALAADFKRQAGIPESSAANTVSPYRPFINAIQMGNTREAADQLAILRNGSFSEMQIRHYVAEEYPHGTIMSNHAQEAAFVQSLTPEQQTQYQQARERRWDTAKKAITYLIANPPAGAGSPSATMRVFKLSQDLQAKRKAAGQ